MWIQKINDGMHALHNAEGLHVGNFKWIKGQWKFKAVGYGPAGQVMPGDGPLTDRHNTCLAHLDEAWIQAKFFQE